MTESLEFDVKFKKNTKDLNDVGETIAKGMGSALRRLGFAGLGESVSKSGTAANVGIGMMAADAMSGGIMMIANALMDFPLVVGIMKLLKTVLLILFMPLIPILKPVMLLLGKLAMFLLKWFMPSSPAQKKATEAASGPVGSILAAPLGGVPTAGLVASVGAKLAEEVGKIDWGKLFSDAFTTLSNVGQWLWDNIILPGWNAVLSFGTWIWEQIVLPGWNTLLNVGENVYNDVLLPAFEWFLGVGEKIWTDVLKPSWDWFLGIGEKIWTEILKPAWDWFAGIGTKLWDIIKSPFESIGQTIKNVLNGLIDWVNGMLPKKFKLPHLASGGIVTSPTIAMVGEKGPEAVIPLNKANSMGTVNITINNPNFRNNNDMKDLVREIEKILGNDLRRRVSYNG